MSVSALLARKNSLAGLISRLGVDVERWDRSFARQLATALAAESEHLTIPVVEQLDLQDVVVTFSLTDHVSVVVTGRLPHTPGELTLRWQEADFARVAAHLSPKRAATPAYLVCSLDYGPAGRVGTLRAAAGRIPAGQQVRIRALATVDQRQEWRVQALGLAASVPMDDLILHNES